MFYAAVNCLPKEKTEKETQEATDKDLEDEIDPTIIPADGSASCVTVDGKPQCKFSLIKPKKICPDGYSMNDKGKCKKDK